MYWVMLINSLTSNCLYNPGANTGNVDLFLSLCAGEYTVIFLKLSTYVFFNRWKFTLWILISILKFHRNSVKTELNHSSKFTNSNHRIKYRALEPRTSDNVPVVLLLYLSSLFSIVVPLLPPLQPSPALLKYNWYVTLCKFELYNVMIWYILWNN